MTLSEWDETPWAGVAVAESVRVESSAATVKAAPTGDFAAHIMYGNFLDRRNSSPQAIMRRAQVAFHRNPWIGTAETVVTRRVAGLPWHLEDAEDEEYEEPFPAPVKAAFDLLEKPQAKLPPEMRDPGLLTRRALISLTSRHMGLCNLAYWFLDQPDINGLPLALLYVNPARVWPSVTQTGRITGWVVDPHDEYGNGGTPLALNELLPFYLNPPDHGPYGSGLFERVMLKVQITTLADQHAAYVLGTGGRLAGIVSPKEGTIPQEQYDSLVKEFRNVNEAPDAAKRTTIMRGPIDFTKTAASPNELDLIELDKMNRDDIFAVWGVPPSQAGVSGQRVGLNSGDMLGHEEAVLMQGAVHDRVVAIRETVQFGLLDRWLSVGTTIDLEIEEPEFDDKGPMFEIAAKALNLPLTNLERRDLVGLAPFGDDRDEEVWLPALLQPAYQSTTNGPLLPPTTPPTATAATPKIGAPLPPEAKASKREFLGLRRSISARWVPAVRRVVAKVLADQRQDVAAKVRSASAAEIERHRKDAKHWMTSGKEADRLRKVLAPVLAGIAEAVAGRTNDLLKDARPTKADPFTDTVVQFVLSKIGERIIGITATTQDAVANAIAQGFDQGWSPAQIANSIETLPAFDPTRAELVARTETMFAYNDAALTSYREFDVKEVEAIDGDKDDECASRDGQTFPVDEAFGIQDHPNGTLDWLPVL